MRGLLDPAEDEHVVLGLIFLKYISDVFEERRPVLGRAIREESIALPITFPIHDLELPHGLPQTDRLQSYAVVPSSHRCLLMLI
jgi:type I restriction-modification system DNA methylase subunit